MSKILSKNTFASSPDVLIGPIGDKPLVRGCLPQGNEASESLFSLPLEREAVTRSPRVFHWKCDQNARARAICLLRCGAKELIADRLAVSLGFFVLPDRLENGDHE
ncbi:hypothetical protein L596_025258 [Steinernema carpocapsae]|uniref:Uncharacterized protein n=1 Tax=Steinernema carpocapsae TaxID=34508 RepID=A0A4U5M843_STECR|nr:hypothetical protein L596_025258 [Steinernema carpocapsae]